MGVSYTEREIEAKTRQERGGEMGQVRSEETSRAEFGAEAQGLHKRVHEWRQAHPEASFDEIAEVVCLERKRLMGSLIGELATKELPIPFDRICPDCGGALKNKGKKKREVLHREGEVRLERENYHCPACKQGIFPPGQAARAQPPQLESGHDSHGPAAGSGDRLV